MARDHLGNSVTGDDPAALAAIDDFVGGFLAYQPRMADVIAAAAAHPNHALVQTYAAAVTLFGETPVAARDARPYLVRAAACAANERERATLDAVTAWAQDRIPDAIALGEAIVAASPRDLAAVKLAQYHAFNRGDFDTLLRVALAALPASADVAAAHGLAAFGYEQTHRLDEAEAAARAALAIERAEPWSHHALLHVFLTRGRFDEGLAFARSVEDTWVGLNSFMHTHLWWHVALFRLARGETAEALRLWDGEVWGREPGYSQDQAGAVSLLAQIELAGGDAGGRWARLEPWLAARADDTVQPLLSLQYLYGLARADAPQTETLLEAIAARAATAPDHARAAWANAALPAARGLVAHARGDWAAAARELDQAMPVMQSVGGSHAQRDLFERIHRDARARAPTA